MFSSYVYPISRGLRPELKGFRLSVPFSLGRGREGVVAVPVSTEGEKISGVEGLRLCVPGFVNFKRAVLRCHTRLLRSTLICPDHLPIGGVLSLFASHPNAFLSTCSLFRSRFSPTKAERCISSSDFGQVG